ncbi:MAG: hypothetical protein ACLKAK_11525 [Alkaliphilus sp.]
MKEKFSGSNVLVYERFNDELKNIIAKSGNKNDFVRKYRRNLRVLEEYRQNCVKHKCFEKLKKSNSIFSMRLTGIMNIRILFFFLVIEGQEKMVLLYPFQEKNNKKHSKDSYGDAIPIASRRTEEIERKIKYERRVYLYI